MNTKRRCDIIQGLALIPLGNCAEALAVSRGCDDNEAAASGTGPADGACIVNKQDDLQKIQSTTDEETHQRGLAR